MQKSGFLAVLEKSEALTTFLISCHHLEMNSPACVDRAAQSPEPGFVGPEAYVIWEASLRKINP